MFLNVIVTKIIVFIIFVPDIFQR